MNFKYVVAFLLGGFILMMSILVYKSVSTNFYLVTDKYYEEGVHHDDKQQKLDNTADLETKLSVVFVEEQVIIQIPSEVDSGTVFLYRPSNATMDKSFLLKANQKVIQIPMNGLDKGKWIVKADWYYNSKSFYSEKSFFIKE